MEGLEEIAQKRLGDCSTEGEVGGKRIRFDEEDSSPNNEEKQPEMEIKEKEEEIEKLRQQLALRIESEETAKANYDDLVSQLAAKVECPVCFEVPKSAPIHSCINGHLVCRDCRRDTCPTCRVPLGPSSLLRNIPLEKLAKTYFERCPNSPISSLRLLAPASALEAASRASSRRSSVSRQQTISQGSPSWPHDDMDSRIFDW
jgi:hypothetical protein